MGTSSSSSSPNSPPGDPSIKRIGRRRPGELREDIVAAATALFLAHGFDGASMRDIAAKADTTQAMLYRHFPSKAALFNETVVAPFHEFVRTFLHEMRSHSKAELPNAELFEKFTTHVYDLSCQNRQLLLALFAAHEFSGDSIGETMSPHGPGLIDLVDELKNEHEERGWDAVDIDIATRASVAMILGFALFEDWLFPHGAGKPSRAPIIRELAALQVAGFERQRQPPGSGSASRGRA